jgi:hypothetical protein
LDAPRVEAALGNVGETARAEFGSDVGQIEAGRKVVTLGRDQSHPKFWISIKFAEGQSKLLQHINRCRISLFGAVQAHFENVSVAAHNDARRITFQHLTPMLP